MIERLIRDYVEDIAISIGRISEFIQGTDFETFRHDPKTIAAVERQLEIIGFPQIPWREMTGLRDKLIHEYFGIDLRVLWRVAAEEIRESIVRGRSH
jgi:uncharacterized protein with HEPN domain